MIGPCRIGANAVVAAVSVVVEDVPMATLVAGVPARVVHQIHAQVGSRACPNRRYAVRLAQTGETLHTDEDERRARSFATYAALRDGDIQVVDWLGKVLVTVRAEG